MGLRANWTAGCLDYAGEMVTPTPEMFASVHVVGAAILDSDKKVLICRRSGKSMSGMWEFPGGKVESGETAEEALEREILEELGVPIKVGDHVATGFQSSDGVTIELSVFEAQLVDELPEASSDHDAMAWVATNDLGNYRFPEADLPAVTVLLNRSR